LAPQNKKHLAAYKVLSVLVLVRAVARQF